MFKELIKYIFVNFNYTMISIQKVKFIAIKFATQREIYKSIEEFILEKNLSNVIFVKKNLQQLAIKMIMKEDIIK